MAKRVVLQPEQFGKVCLLPSRKEWSKNPRKRRANRKAAVLRLAQWLLVETPTGDTRTVDYRLLKRILTSLRKTPNVAVHMTYLHMDIVYPRGRIRLYLDNPEPGFRRLAAERECIAAFEREQATSTTAAA